MLLQKDLKKITDQLLCRDPVKVNIEGNEITIQTVDRDGSKLSLSAPVYVGTDFIPQSVRHSLLEKVSFTNEKMKTFFSVDEGHFRVFLVYLGQSESLNQKKFKTLLEDFTLLANAWRAFLDEHDKRDLIHVRVK
jgi:hypothetical protein